VRRILFVVAALVVGASLLATLAWVVVTLGVRPLDGVEGDVLFEADRIRAGYPLFVDPAIGAREYGEPPARYLVLYPPLWSAFLALWPSVVFARIVGSLAWLGALGWIVWRAPKERRLAAGALATLCASIWVLALYGASGRPDSLAVLLSAVALERSARKGDVDAIAGALFALAAFVKPNVIGAAPGAIVVAFLATRRLRGFLAAVATTTFVFAVLHLTSGGKFLGHLLASTGQPPDASLFMEQLVHRVPFFVGPLGFAFAAGIASRKDQGARIALGALATSSAWSLLCLAKIGSATNYFLEPLACAVVVLARADLPSFARSGIALPIACVVQSLWTGIASVKSATKEIGLSFQRADAVAKTRATCGAGLEDVVIADEPGLERMLDGRIVATPFQTTHLARRGRFDETIWIADVQRPEVKCLYMQDDLLERPLDQVSVAHDRFGPELRRALRERFVLVAHDEGYRIYRARGREERP
jgi:hypothetical protein